MLNPLGEKALAKLDLQSNSKVLDIGCGCGATTLEIAQIVSEGAVTGLDISVPMLDKAKSEAKIQGIANVDFKSLMFKLNNWHTRNMILYIPDLELCFLMTRLKLSKIYFLQLEQVVN